MRQEDQFYYPPISCNTPPARSIFNLECEKRESPSTDRRWEIVPFMEDILHTKSIVYFDFPCTSGWGFCVSPLSALLAKVKVCCLPCMHIKSPHIILLYFTFIFVVFSFPVFQVLESFNLLYWLGCVPIVKLALVVCPNAHKYLCRLQNLTVSSRLHLYAR